MPSTMPLLLLVLLLIAQQCEAGNVLGMALVGALSHQMQTVKLGSTLVQRGHK